MDTLENLVLVTHVLAALAIIGLVLLQQGKGAEMGAGFGSGSSATIFGSAGAGNFLTKATVIVAIVFFCTSFSLAYFAAGKTDVSAETGIPVIDKVIPDTATGPASEETKQSVPGSEANPSSDNEAGLPEDSGTGDTELPEL